MGGEECGEAWSSVVSGVCGVALVVGAASVLRLPRLIYQHGAGERCIRGREGGRGRKGEEGVEGGRAGEGKKGEEG